MGDFRMSEWGGGVSATVIPPPYRPSRPLPSFPLLPTVIPPPYRPSRPLPSFPLLPTVIPA